jgi:hypothetical protein
MNEPREKWISSRGILTPHANYGKITERRNPDYDAYKDALPISIQDPTLATGDLMLWE